MAACTEVNDVKDVQSEKDLRNIPLKHVGIKGLRWPIELRDKARGTQHSVAEVTLAGGCDEPFCGVSAYSRSCGPC